MSPLSSEKISPADAGTRQVFRCKSVSLVRRTHDRQPGGNYCIPPRRESIHMRGALLVRALLNLGILPSQPSEQARFATAPYAYRTLVRAQGQYGGRLNDLETNQKKGGHIMSGAPYRHPLLRAPAIDAFLSDGYSRFS